MLLHKVRAEPQCTPQPVQQAQATIQWRALNPVAAVLLGNEPQPVIALDFIARVGYILQGFGVINPVESREDLWSDSLAR